MDKPVLLDLCCCAGGAARGYHDAGFEVIGVDIAPQPNYPYRFLQADGLDYLDSADLSQVSAIHVSAPCQGFSLASHFHGVQGNYPNLIPLFRSRLRDLNKPYVIENVAGAPLEKSIMLCGTMFGLNVVRHRYFETNILILQPHHVKHTRRTGKPGAIPAENEYWCVGGHFGQKDRAQAAMGIDWMKTQHEIAEAIPPAYTRHIGYFLKLAVMAERECVA